MKLIRFGNEDQEKAGLIDAGGKARDASSLIGDLTPDTISAGAIAKLAGAETEELPEIPTGTRLGCPVGDIGKFICVGLNYSDHARELGMEIPTEPVLFHKALSSISGPDDQIVIPPAHPTGSAQVDWEVELGIVISATAKHIREEEAMNHIAGFCVVNDVSDRRAQMEHQGQWTKGKSYDGFGPVGPWLVTPDEAGETSALDIWSALNGERQQDGNTHTFIFSPAYCVAYISRFMTLNPGDLIATGTPPGVGMGKKPEPKFMTSGDIMTCGIEGLGQQTHEVI